MESSRILKRPVEPQPVKKIRPPFFSERKTAALISSDASRGDELAERFYDIRIHVEQKFQRGGDVLFRHVAQIGRDRMRRLGDQRAQLELAADPQKFLRTCLRT